MVRRLIRSVLPLLLAVSAVVAAAPAAAATPTIEFQVVEARTELRASGLVAVGVRARCSPTLDAFELSIGVRQPYARGSVSRIGERYPVCNGAWQHNTFYVRPASGKFHHGLATVDLYLGAYDTVNDHDVEATDIERVRI
jgi:hypothetical protein